MPDARRRGGHRLRSLVGWRRWAVVASIVAFGLLPVAVAGRALADGWEPTGDVAIIAVRSLDAWTGQAPLVGQPTTGRELAGVSSFHPGPLQNWLVGPLLHLVGPAAGLALGVAAINGAALTASVWLAHRRGGPALALLCAAMLALLVHALGPGSLYDPYNSELPTYPLVLVALAAWSVVAVDLVATPVLVVAASIASQAHVAGATTALPMAAVAAIVLGRSLRTDPELRRSQRTILVASLAAGILCWLPPLAQEIVGPSNVRALWRTATASGPSLGLAFTLERVVTAVAPVPLFARRTGAYGFLVVRGAVAVLAAGVIVGGAGSAALAARFRHGRRQPAQLALVVGVALAVTVAVWAGSPPIAAFRVDSIRWLWVLGLLVWLLLLWSGWWFAPAHLRRSIQRAAPTILAVVAVATVASTVAGANLHDVRDARYLRPVRELGDATIDADLPPGRYHLRASGSDAVVTVAPAIVLRLEAAGHAVALDRGPFTVAYGPDRTSPLPAVVGSIAVTSDAPVDGRLLASRTFEGADGDPVTVWVTLEEPS